jgi:hypothetical protein
VKSSQDKRRMPPMDGEPGAPVNEQSQEKPEEVQLKEVVFWARAVNLSIANWVTEIISHGKIVRPEQSLKFSNHIFVASHNRKNPDGISEVDFIKNSKSFESGTDVKMCENVAEAMKWSGQQHAVKNTRPDEVEDVVSVSREQPRA